MAEKRKNTAFILSTRKWSDSSLIVTMISRETGILKLIAKGALKPKSPFSGKFEVFNLVEIVYSEKSTRQLQILTEIDVISHYPQIRKESSGLSGLFVMAEIVLNLIHEHEEVELFFRHLVRLIDWLNDHPEKITTVLLNFVTAILNFSGYGLNYLQCNSCGKLEIADKVYISLEHGNYYCNECKKFIHEKYCALPAELVQLLRLTNPYKNLINSKVNVNNQLISTFLYFLNDYLTTHLGKNISLKSIDIFLKML